MHFNFPVTDDLSFSWTQPDIRHPFAKIKVSAEAKSNWSFKLVPEDSSQMIFKALRLVKEIQLGDLEWDEAVYIVGDGQAIQELLSTHPDLKKSIYSLIKCGCKIQIESERISITKVVAFDDVESVSKSLVQMVRNLRSSFSAALEKGISAEPQRNLIWTTLVLFLISGLFLFLISVSLSLDETGVQHLGGTSGFIGFVLGGSLGILLLILWRVVRPLHSRSHYEFALMMFLLPIGFAVAGGSSSLYFNRVLDSSKGVLVQSEIVKLYSLSTKGGIRYITVYQFQLPSEIYKRPGPKRISMDVDLNDFLVSKVGDRKVIRMYPGFFGHPWISL